MKQKKKSLIKLEMINNKATITINMLLITFFTLLFLYLSDFYISSSFDENLTFFFLLLFLFYALKYRFYEKNTHYLGLWHAQAFFYERKINKKFECTTEL